MFDEFPEEERPFLEAIREDPTSLDTRRVYADWLDERGDTRGEFLRLECQLEEARRRVRELPDRLGTFLGNVEHAWVAEVTFRYTLLLESFHDKLATIRAMRNLTDMGLREAKDFVESAPVLLGAEMSIAEADRYVREFQGFAVVRPVPVHQPPL